MTSISAVHLRTFVRMFQGTPEMLARILGGSGIAVGDVDDPEFELPIQSFWAIFDNIVEIFGEDWFLNFPILWSQDLQTDVGLAMRLSPNIGEGLGLLTTYWLSRWPIGEIEATKTASALHVAISPVFKMKPETWAVAMSLLALNFATLNKLGISEAKSEQPVRYEFNFERPPYADRLIEMIDGELSWGEDGNRLIVPNAILNARSVTADKKQLANLLDAIAKAGEKSRAKAASKSTADDVLARLSAVKQGQVTLDQIAKQLGLSTRSLERKLMDEGTSFKELNTASLKQRISALLLVPGNNAETIAFQLGYHDGSSVMRACKRWFGKPLSQVRAELRANA